MLSDLNTSLEIVEAGVSTPAGIGLLRCASAVRCSNNIAKAGKYFTEGGEGIPVAEIDDAFLPPLSSSKDSVEDAKFQRLLKLSISALLDLRNRYENLNQKALLILLPDDFIGLDFIAHLEQQMGIEFHREHSSEYGVNAAADLFAKASIMLESNSEQEIIIGSADTRCDANSLANLLGENRLLVNENADGFIPGEGAGFAVIKKNKAKESQGLSISAWGDGHEKLPVLSQGLAIGDGLSQAINTALANREAITIATVLNNFNGESWCGKEWGVARMRNHQSFQQDEKMFHPAAVFGDVGGAHLIIMLGLALIGFRKSYYEFPLLISFSQEQGERVVLVLTQNGVDSE